MANLRESHTTTDNKARCLAYRNGKRCGRIAKTLCNYKNVNGQTCFQARCSECAGHADVFHYIECENGFVVSSSNVDGWQERHYRPLGPAVAVDVDSRVD